MDWPRGAGPTHVVGMNTITLFRPWTELVTELDDRVATLGAAADARSEELHRMRRLPPDLFRAVTEAGLLRQLVPVELDGLGRAPIDWFRTGVALARHDASLGWVVTQGAAELAWIAAGADEAWARIVLSDPEGASASSTAGVGTLTIEGDSARLSGRWAFNTGCHGATWIGGMAVVRDDTTPPDGLQLRFGWVPAERAEIIETWDPSGLHGTGSHTTVIDEPDVPLAWTFDPFAPTSHDRGPYRVVVGNGNWPIATAVAATQLGNARRALDEATTVAMTKTPMPDLVPLASNGAVQRGLAELEGRWHAAHAVVEAELVAMWDDAVTGGELSVDQRIRLHRANISANRISVDIVDRLCDLTGTTSVDRRHPLARTQRDALALRGHIAVGGSSMEHNTLAVLGLEAPHHLV